MNQLHPKSIPSTCDLFEESVYYIDLSLSIALNCETNRVGYVLVGKTGYFDAYFSTNVPIPEEILCDEYALSEYLKPYVEFEDEENVYENAVT